MKPLAEHIARAGFEAGTPVVVARVAGSSGIDASAAGYWPDGSAVTTDDLFYAASLAKQVTGCAAAMLVRDKTLDPDQPIETWLRDIAPRVRGVTPRQLAHHIAGLPPSGELEAGIVGDWTATAARAAIAEAATQWPRGERYLYSNIGYLLLADVVAAASGMRFADFVAGHLFDRLGLSCMSYPSSLRNFQQTALMGRSLPLTLGDGGLWSTAPAFAGWLMAQNSDALGVADIVERGARLKDGTITDYGWGVGIREHRGHPLFIHGGEWTGAAAKAIRSRYLGVGIVAMTAGGSTEAVSRLVSSLLDEG